MKNQVLNQLNEISKGGEHPPGHIQTVVWAGVGRLRDAESILMEMLVDQETLADGIRNECLVEKAKKYFGITD